MKIKYRRKFLKDISKIPFEVREEIEKYVFNTFAQMNNIFESQKVEKMKGYKSFYKIRFGSYRIGFKLENDAVIFERALHRKEIDRYFP